MSWVYDQAHPNMDRLSRYLDHVTGLKVSRQSELSKSNRDRIVEAEAYQVC